MKQGGFSLVELVIALTIALLLVSLTVVAFGSPLRRFGLRGARSTFVSLHARARAASIESGRIVSLIVVPSTDSIAVRRGSTTLDAVNVMQDFDVDLQTASTRLELCMGPRGYAEDSCNSFTTAQTVFFVLGTDTVSVDVLPLGQLIY